MDLLADIRAVVGSEPIAFSSVSVIELDHGIWRAKDAATAERRRKFFDDLFARRAARVGGEGWRRCEHRWHDRHIELPGV